VSLKDFITKKGIYIGVAAIIIAIIASITAALGSGGASFGEILSEPFFKPLKTAMTSMVNSLEGVYGYIYRYDEIVAENEELKNRVATLEDEYREYTEISAENARLKALMDFDNSNSDSNFVYKSATIISWTASNFSSSFTINKGTSSGVDVDDCVITENGYLVGVVTEAGKSSSTVVSIIDTTMSIGAMLYSNSETGVIEGNFELFKQGKLKLSYINSNANVVIGDSVVTSGRGGIYPSGLVIGYVDSIGENPSGLDYYAVVSPAADFDSITHLYVITDFDAD
jgi:rod shape-determining protein MreC